MKRLIAALIAAGACLASPSARSEQLVTALSHDAVSITSNFTGSQVVIFGTIERDAQTVARSSNYEVVVALSGPLTTLVTRRKDRTVGLWINRDSERIGRVPSFLSVHSTNDLEAIAAPSLRAQLGIGLDMLPINATTSKTPPVRTDFEDAFLRLMQESRLYKQEEGSVEFLSAQLFRVPVVLPANVPVGTYTATVFLFRDGAMLSTTSEEMIIEKVGFEQLMTLYAHQHGLIYGIGTVLIACLTGWLAGIIFRRD
ncbi:TIGR02186 family protein [Chthonobacter albigriseus]|uniref:TIGR02186 family protein n=1 Tax=Chthonobacter albigriseus TaxID=1683161 RepID=UPI0015EF8E35|nr:TIGR02186 family protein [Chthonobacter albigriseus]